MGRMKKLVACMLLAAHVATGQEFTVETVSCVYTKVLPRGLLSQFNGGFGDQGALEQTETPKYEVGFLVSGLGIVGIAHDSLVVDSITTREGNNIARDYRGLRAYKMGDTYRGMNGQKNEELPVSPDGKHAYFTVCGNSDVLAPGEVPHIKGRVSIQCAFESKPKTLTLKAGEAYEERIGPFDFKLEPTDGNPGSVTQISLNMPKNFQNNLSNFQITADGKTLDFKSSMNWGPNVLRAERMSKNDNALSSAISYSFKLAPDTEVSVVLEYWTEIKTFTVPFETHFVSAEPVEDEE